MPSAQCWKGVHGLQGVLHAAVVSIRPRILVGRVGWCTGVLVVTAVHCHVDGVQNWVLKRPVQAGHGSGAGLPDWSRDSLPISLSPAVCSSVSLRAWHVMDVYSAGFRLLPQVSFSMLLGQGLPLSGGPGAWTSFELRGWVG